MMMKEPVMVEEEEEVAEAEAHVVVETKSQRKEAEDTPLEKH